MDQRIGVLLVDDKADVRNLLRATLEPDGRFEIVGEAGDGLEAVTVAASVQPDVALVDLAMPHMDGMEAIQRIRAGSPGTKIIVLSGYAASFMSSQVLAHGAHAYVQKGGPPQALIAAIAKLHGKPAQQDDEPTRAQQVSSALAAPVTASPPALASAAPFVRTVVTAQAPVRAEASPVRAEAPRAEVVRAAVAMEAFPAAVQPEAGPAATAPDDTPLWELLSFLIHEMQGSLTVIGGFAATLRASAEKMDRDGILGCVEPIERNARNLSDLIRQLADIRALDTDALDLQTSETSLGGLVRQAVADLSVVTQPHPIRVEVLDSGVADLDAVRVRQIVTNLLSNAAKFSPSDQPIEVVVERGAGELMVSVTDRCGGIPTDRTHELFTKFSRLGSTFKGTGLGLYLSRGIARAHGGDLRHEAAPGGCRFALSLPLPPGAFASLSMPTQTGRVLVVDDEPDLSMLIEHHLKAQGLEVHVAGDGPTAIEMAKRLQPDLILLDVMMQGMSGYAVCERLREDPRSANAFIIMLTARVQTEDRMLGLTAGADEYLTKPFDPEELVARVKAALRRVREMRALSPLTGLPGNIHIQQRIERLVAESRPFALLYADLDHFKAYNDRFGFVRGDRAIQAVGIAIRDVVDAHGGPSAFTGHVGGDDFVAIVAPESAEIVAEGIVERFDRLVPELYDESDLVRGSIDVIDRRGEPQRYPLLTISVGVTSTENRTFGHFGEVVTVANELKQFAKREERSSYALDRRSAPREAV
jgi:diguanylate cyclase (GGDEF)-like protein